MQPDIVPAATLDSLIRDEAADTVLAKPQYCCDERTTTSHTAEVRQSHQLFSLELQFKDLPKDISPWLEANKAANSTPNQTAISLATERSDNSNWWCHWGPFFMDTPHTLIWGPWACIPVLQPVTIYWVLTLEKSRFWFCFLFQFQIKICNPAKTIFSTLWKKNNMIISKGYILTDWFLWNGF